MGKTITEKILSKYANKDLKPEEIVSVPVDRLIFMDSKSVEVFSYFEGDLGQTHLKNPDRIVMVCDHLGIGHDIASAQIIEQFRLKAKKYGIKNFYGIGNTGIGHQIMLEDGFVAPGTVALGCDSHSITYGAVGAFACGISRSETAVVMATGEMWLMVPATVKVELTGELPFGCCGKDVALKILNVLKTNKHALYKALEIVGEGVKSLSMDDRIAICNMMAEAGAKNCIIPVDDITREYLKNRLSEPYQEILSDDDANFAAIFSIDLDDLVPMLAPPNLLDDARPVSEFEGVPISRAFLGSCASGRLEELGIAANLFEGKRISEDVTMVVAPASQKIYIACAKQGYLQTFAAAGASVESPGCASCSGEYGGLLPDDAICISTSNRNSSGRMGSSRASIYLASAATVAASALNGCITDPRACLRESNIGGNIK